jgi:hypothetical protein
LLRALILDGELGRPRDCRDAGGGAVLPDAARRAGLFLGHAGLDETEIRAGIERLAEVLCRDRAPEA